MMSEARIPNPSAAEDALECAGCAGVAEGGFRGAGEGGELGEGEEGVKGEGEGHFENSPRSIMSAR